MKFLKSIIKKRKISILSDNFRFWIVSMTLFFCFFTTLFSVYSFSGNDLEADFLRQEEPAFIIFQDNSLSSFSNPLNPPLKVVKTIPVIITAYSSTPSQTDDTPYITASGTFVREGIVANNYLAFGTEIRIPEIYGDRVFTVEDRMSDRKGYYHVDIWLPDYYQALSFGAQITHIEVLGK